LIMMLEKLRSEVIKYALMMYAVDLVPANRGNVSARDSETNLVDCGTERRPQFENDGLRLRP
jgi:ribulose-5-phosphate 4-epimerase/fuculose-1-phosphate aldolase